MLGSEVFLGEPSPRRGPRGGGSGRIGRFKGVGSFLGHAGGKLSTTTDLTPPNLRAIFTRELARLTMIAEDLNGARPPFCGFSTWLAHNYLWTRRKGHDVGGPTVSRKMSSTPVKSGTPTAHNTSRIVTSRLLVILEELTKSLLNSLFLKKRVMQSFAFR